MFSVSLDYHVSVITCVILWWPVYDVYIGISIFLFFIFWFLLIKMVITCANYVGFEAAHTFSFQISTVVLLSSFLCQIMLPCLRYAISCCDLNGMNFVILLYLLQEDLMMK